VFHNELFWVSSQSRPSPHARFPLFIPSRLAMLHHHTLQLLEGAHVPFQIIRRIKIVQRALVHTRTIGVCSHCLKSFHATRFTLIPFLHCLPLRVCVFTAIDPPPVRYISFTRIGFQLAKSQPGDEKEDESNVDLLWR